jgi:hypothetical protein
VFDGPIDNPSFLAYVDQILMPTLRPGDVVVPASRILLKARKDRPSGDFVLLLFWNA